MLVQVATGSVPASTPPYPAPKCGHVATRLPLPAQGPSRDTHHTSARVVLWALARAWQERSAKPNHASDFKRKLDSDTHRNSSTQLGAVGTDGVIARDGVEVQHELAADRMTLGTGLERGKKENESLHCCFRIPKDARDADTATFTTTAEEETNVVSEIVGTSWEFHEGVLMAYEGTLKKIMEGAMAALFSEPCPDGNRVSPIITVDSQPEVNSDDPFVDPNIPGYRWRWPQALKRATPPLSELLVLLKDHAEIALYNAELGLQNQRGDYSLDETSGRKLTGAMEHTLKVPPGGLLELWRAGSQLLPSIARAMTWWNPAALRG